MDRSESRLEERERQLGEREAEHAEALAALETSRKALEGAAAFVQVHVCLVHVIVPVVAFRPLSVVLYFGFPFGDALFC